MRFGIERIPAHARLQLLERGGLAGGCWADANVDGDGGRQKERVLTAFEYLIIASTPGDSWHPLSESHNEMVQVRRSA